MHCESRKGLWLQGEAAFEAHSFREAEPQPGIPHNDKKKHELSPKQPDQARNISMTTNDPCLLSTVKQGSDVCHFRSSQLGPRIRTRLSLYFFFLCLALWLCVKMNFGNRVLVVLLQIGAKDLTVYDTWHVTHGGGWTLSKNLPYEAVHRTAGLHQVC